MNENITKCPVCKNENLKIGECMFEDKIIAYNVYCPVCNFTGRSFRMRWKAIDKWNKMCVQVKNMLQN